MKIPLTLFSYVLLLLCAFSPCEVKAWHIGKDLPCSTGTIVKVSWDVAGGGDLAFEILKEGQEFSILITRYRFRKTHQSFQLSATNKDAFELAKGLFEGTLDPHTDTFVPEEHKYSGMFVSITLDYSDGHQQKIKNIKPSGKLRPIYDFVSSQAIDGTQK